MKTFNTIYNTKNENMINESLGSLLLGLFAVFGFTLYAAVKGCARLFKSDPEDPEDPNQKIPGTYANSPIPRPTDKDLAKIDKDIQGLEPGTKQSLDKALTTIEEDKDLDKDQDKNQDQNNDQNKDQNNDQNKDQNKDQTQNEGFKFEGKDPKDAKVFQQYWMTVLSIKFQDTLNDKNIRSQLEALYNWVVNNNGNDALQEFIKDNKNEKNNQTEIDYVLSECFFKVCCQLIQVDVKYQQYFEDKNSIAVMLKIILLEIFISSSIKTPNILKDPQETLSLIDTIVFNK